MRSYCVYRIYGSVILYYQVSTVQIDLETNNLIIRTLTDGAAC